MGAENTPEKPEGRRLGKAMGVFRGSLVLLVLAGCQMPSAKPETETSLKEQGLLCKEVEGRRECH